MADGVGEALTGMRIEDRRDEPAWRGWVRNFMNPPAVAGGWKRAPPTIEPLTELGAQLGGTQIHKPTAEEMARYFAYIDSLNAEGKP